mmetsp:Transcript_1472/g.3293  ORF Transcript_1472/g.3293 Transcript_1472/m.3293 type:complete len:99 (+) Transcript_1472:1-297(+)
MFEGATAFNSDLSQWQTGKVTNMMHMFQAASRFNSDLSRWDTRKVTRRHAGNMLYLARSFSTEPCHWPKVARHVAKKMQKEKKEQEKRQRRVVYWEYW